MRTGTVPSVTRRYVPLLLLLTALWGSSFLFIEVALDELEPSVLIVLRLLAAALVLVPALALGAAGNAPFAQLRAGWRPLFVLGAINAAIPFTLIAWGQQYIDSGIAAIANASAPIFVALLAIRFRPSEKVTGLARARDRRRPRRRRGARRRESRGRLVGGGRDARRRGRLPSCTRAGALYGQTHVEHLDPILLVSGSTLAGAVILLPLARGPGARPRSRAGRSGSPWSRSGSAGGDRAVRLLRDARGARLDKAALVAYLLPAMALVLGIVFLDEPLTVAAVAGLALVLLGVALGSGLLRSSRRGAARDRSRAGAP